MHHPRHSAAGVPVVLMPVLILLAAASPGGPCTCTPGRQHSTVGVTHLEAAASLEFWCWQQDAVTHASVDQLVQHLVAALHVGWPGQDMQQHTRCSTQRRTTNIVQRLGTGLPLQQACGSSKANQPANLRQVICATLAGVVVQPADVVRCQMWRGMIRGVGCAKQEERLVRQ